MVRRSFRSCGLFDIPSVASNLPDPTASTNASLSLVGVRADQLELFVLFLGHFLLELHLGHELCESERAADVDRR